MLVISGKCKQSNATKLRSLIPQYQITTHAITYPQNRHRLYDRERFLKNHAFNSAFNWWFLANWYRYRDLAYIFLGDYMRSWFFVLNCLQSTSNTYFWVFVTSLALFPLNTSTMMVISYRTSRQSITIFLSEAHREHNGPRGKTSSKLWELYYSYTDTFFNLKHDFVLHWHTRHLLSKKRFSVEIAVWKKHPGVKFYIKI